MNSNRYILHDHIVGRYSIGRYEKKRAIVNIVEVSDFPTGHERECAFEICLRECSHSREQLEREKK